MTQSVVPASAGIRGPDDRGVNLPSIVGERCTLRQLRPADAASVQRHADDEAVWVHLLEGFPHPYTMADAEAWCNGGWREAGDVFGIETGDEIIGCIGAVAFKAPGRACNAEVGWWIGRSCWGRGIAVEALVRFVPWLWRERPALTRLAATIYSRNTRSQRVAEKAGWSREAYQPKSIVKAGEVIDAILYAAYRP